MVRAGVNNTSAEKTIHRATSTSYRPLPTKEFFRRKRDTLTRFRFTNASHVTVLSVSHTQHHNIANKDDQNNAPRGGGNEAPAKGKRPMGKARMPRPQDLPARRPPSYQKSTTATAVPPLIPPVRAMGRTLRRRGRTAILHDRVAPAALRNR